MKNENCRKIRTMLVDYSDGALPAGDARQITEHLASCPDCREELRLLEHSLSLAREIWNESALAEPLSKHNKALAALPTTAEAIAESRGNDDQPLAVSRKISRRTLVWIGGAATACAIAAFLLFNQPVKPKKDIDVVQHKEEFDVMQYIAREECSARLAASVQILADEPGLEQYKEDAERFLKTNYAGTSAVRMMEKRPNSINENNSF
jgi:hypothetical protein